MSSFPYISHRMFVAAIGRKQSAVDRAHKRAKPAAPEIRELPLQALPALLANHPLRPLVTAIAASGT